jgi:hypothetical protein
MAHECHEWRMSAIRAPRAGEPAPKSTTPLRCPLFRCRLRSREDSYKFRGLGQQLPSLKVRGGDDPRWRPRRPARIRIRRLPRRRFQSCGELSGCSRPTRRTIVRRRRRGGSNQLSRHDISVHPSRKATAQLDHHDGERSSAVSQLGGERTVVGRLGHVQFECMKPARATFREIHGTRGTDGSRGIA